MGQSKPFPATALIVEDDLMQREMLSLLLEESGYRVIECTSAEDAKRVLDKDAAGLCLLMTDVQLAGTMNGVELACIAKARNPRLDVVVTSGRPLPKPTGGLLIEASPSGPGNRLSRILQSCVGAKSRPNTARNDPSGRPLPQPLPDGAKFWAKPWAPLDVLREAEYAQLPS